MSFDGKPALATAAPIVNDGFWPDVDLGRFMSEYRIPSEYADDTIKWGVELALVNVNLDLQEAKAAMVQRGSATAAAYAAANPQPLAGDDVLLMQYRAAIGGLAKAFLLNQFNSINRKPNAEAAMKEAPETEQFWKDQSAKSVSAIIAQVLPDHDLVPANDGVHFALI